MWCLLLCLSGTMLLDALEVSTALVSVADIGADFGTDGADLHWVVTGFAIGMGVTLIGGRRLVRRQRAVSTYSAFGAWGFSTGLVLAGVLTEISWLDIRFAGSGGPGAGRRRLAADPARCRRHLRPCTWWRFGRACRHPWATARSRDDGGRSPSTGSIGQCYTFLPGVICPCWLVTFVCACSGGRGGW
ncbi:hypothetical protein EF847_07440 [Actinobacteria bacterium YIM 96077]|nr:hypothetical protein EF847_07440 [Actinobacteria bacterium YIM 96077]